MKDVPNISFFKIRIYTIYNIVLHYNTSVHEANNFAPHELILGKRAWFLVRLLIKNWKPMEIRGTYRIARMTEIRNFPTDYLNTAKECTILSVQNWRLRSIYWRNQEVN